MRLLDSGDDLEVGDRNVDCGSRGGFDVKTQTALKAERLLAGLIYVLLNIRCLYVRMSELEEV